MESSTAISEMCLSENTIFNLLSLIISALALLASLCTLFQQFKVKIKIRVDEDDSFIIEPLETIGGNRASVLLSVDIENNSFSPITIENVVLTTNEKKYVLSSSPAPPGFCFLAPSGEGDRLWNPNHETVKFPMRMAQYDYKRLYLVFKKSYCPATDDYEKVKITVSTPKKKYRISANISTPIGRSKWFQ